VNDTVVFQSMMNIVKATNQFQSVRWGRLESPLANPTGGHVILQRLSWAHDHRQAAMDTLERRVRFRVDLRYYHPDVPTRNERIITCESVIFNILNNSSLGGLVIPVRTTVETGTDNVKEDLQPGLSQVMMDGYFSYSIDPSGGLNA
jgi:hypothetical protein